MDNRLMHQRHCASPARLTSTAAPRRSASTLPLFRARTPSHQGTLTRRVRGPAAAPSNNSSELNFEVDANDDALQASYTSDSRGRPGAPSNDGAVGGNPVSSRAISSGPPREHDEVDDVAATASKPDTPPAKPAWPLPRVPRIDVSDPSCIPGLLPMPPDPRWPSSSDAAPNARMYTGMPGPDTAEHVDPWMNQQVAALQMDLEHDFALKPAARIYNTTFSDADAMSNHFWRMIHRHDRRKPLGSPQANEVMALLKQGHYNPNSKLGPGVRHFFVGPHPEHGSLCFMIQRVDGSVVDFSYRKCIGNLFHDSWRALQGPSPMAFLRHCATAFLSREYIRLDPDRARPAHKRLQYLSAKIGVPLPLNPREAAEAALGFWMHQREVWQQGGPSNHFNACLAAHTLQTLARLCKAETGCRQMVADSGVVPQLMEMLQRETAVLSPHHLACITWELHSIRYSPPAWLLQQLLHKCTPEGQVALQLTDSIRVVEAILGLRITSAGMLLKPLLDFAKDELDEGMRVGMQYMVSLLASCAKLPGKTKIAPRDLPYLLMERMNRQPIDGLPASKVVVLLWAASQLGQQPSQEMLDKAAEVALEASQPALGAQLWCLLGKLHYQPSQLQLDRLEQWLQHNAPTLHPRGMQRMAWFLGHLAAEDAVPFGHELSVAASVGHLVRAAAELGHDCPVPTAVTCTWAAAQLQICNVGGFEVLWAAFNERPNKTYEALTEMPRHVSQSVLVQAIQVADILDLRWPQLQMPMHPRLRQTAVQVLGWTEHGTEGMEPQPEVR